MSNTATFPFVIAHRGASAQAPENTMSALQRAKALGAKAVEFDVNITRDGVCVLFHDEDLSRCSDGQGQVSAHTWAQLQRLDAGAWFDERFSGEAILRLEQALDFVLDAGLALNLEIKPTTGLETQTAQAVGNVMLDYIGRLGAWPGPLVVSSFSKQALETFASLCPHVSRAYLTATFVETSFDDMVRLGCTSLHCDHSAMDDADLARTVNAMHAHGYPVRCYTVNDVDRAARLKALGIDSIFTDTPDLFA